MMQGKFIEYNWDDIQRLILKDAGLETEEEQRTRGSLWVLGGLKTPEHSKDTCVRVQVYNKPYSERLREHVEGAKPDENI
jgi:hypothetical protein